MKLIRAMRNLQPALCMLCLLCVVAPRALHAQTSPPGSAEATTPVKHPVASLADALQLYRTGKFDSAIQEYQELENGPQAALAYVGLARIYLKEKKPSDAYAAVARSNDLAPQSPETKVALGEVYFRQGKIAEAEKEFVDVINSGANNARAFLGLARVSQAASLYQRAKNMIDRAHQIDPSDPDIRRAWLSTLTLTERISTLKAYLGQETDDNAEGKLGLQIQLALLQGQLDNPGHQCRMVSKISSTQTDLKNKLIDANHLRGFGLDVKVNAVSSRLLLDTGAGGILLNRKIAEKAGIKKLVQTHIRGIGDRGPAGGYIGYADSIQIGELEFQDCDVEVIDRNSAAGEDGIIGADVFSHFLVEIDLPNQKFRLSELPPRPDEITPAAALEAGSTDEPRFRDRYIGPEMAGYSPIFRFGHLLLIRELRRSSMIRPPNYSS